MINDLKIKELPFYSEGYTLEKKTSLGNHSAHSLGYIYVQEIASMVPVLALEPRPGECVLDLCAAPGSKTTQVSQQMHNKGLVVANEMNRKRMQGLLHNVKRCGLMNEVVISMRGQAIDRLLLDYFDRVLIDAPCSAEGTIRKSKAVLFHWGLKNIEKMSRIQKGLVVAGFRTLRPGGTLVYSTCTIAPEENEGVISYLLEKFPEAEVLPISLNGFKTRPGIVKWKSEHYDKRTKNCVRVLPQDNDTAPFFVAKIMKRGVFRQRVEFMGRIPSEGPALQLLLKRFGMNVSKFKELAVFQDRGMTFMATPEVYAFMEMKSVRRGLEVGKIYGQEIKPDGDFIQLFGHHATSNRVEVKEWQLRKLLHGITLKLQYPSLDRGFVIITHKKLPVVVGKYNGQQIKPAVKPDRRIPA